MQIQNRDSNTVLISSFLSSSFTSLFLNPLDVLKIHFSSICQICNPSTTVSSSLKQIIKKEGFATLFSGAKYSLILSSGSIAFFFASYEKIKYNLSFFTKNDLFLPLFSSLTARTLTTFITFPIEYWKILQQSDASLKNKKGFQLGGNISSAFGVFYAREIVFSGIYWILAENVRNLLKKENFGIYSSNLIAGATAGAIACVASLPLDVVKTRRQIHANKLKNVSTIKLIRNIYIKEGSQAFYLGLRPRLYKTVLSCGMVLTLYESFFRFFDEKKKHSNLY